MEALNGQVKQIYSRNGDLARQIEQPKANICFSMLQLIVANS